MTMTYIMGRANFITLSFSTLPEPEIGFLLPRLSSSEQ